MNNATLARIISEILDEIEQDVEKNRIEPRIRLTASTKAYLLDRYATGEIQTFQQFDGFKLDENDDLMRPDEDGHCITAGMVEELRHTGSDLKVRIQIRPNTDAQEAVAIAQKIVDWMQRCAAKEGSRAFTDEVTCIVKYRAKKSSPDSEVTL